MSSSSHDRTYAGASGIALKRFANIEDGNKIITGSSSSNSSENSGTVEEEEDKKDARALKGILSNVYKSVDNIEKEEQLELEDILEKDEESSDDDANYKPEGIFYIKQYSCLEMCRGQKPDRKETIFVFDYCSCYIFSAKSGFRKWIVGVSVSSIFENIIILAIGLNSIVLAIYDYDDRDNEEEYNQFLELLGRILTTMFMVECVTKIIALGFVFHKNAYLRDRWNWIDFLVVIVGAIELTPLVQSSWIKALRVLRVLRPLKSINALPSMRKQISSLLGSLHSLMNASVFMFFIFLLYGILGVQQFGGTMYKRCRFTEEPVDGKWPFDDSIGLCEIDSDCLPGQFCRHPQQAGLSRDIDSPIDQSLIGYGLLQFDSLPDAMLTVFQMITLESWTQVMYNLMDSSMSWMAIFYSVSLILVGSFFLLNVILAVMADAQNNVDATYTMQ